MNNDNYHPLSHSLIALSTAFHEYNPLFISTFHSLLLLNGVDCIITKERSTGEQEAGEEPNKDDDDDDNARPGQEKIFELLLLFFSFITYFQYPNVKLWVPLYIITTNQIIVLQ
jgi:hypothetical protein